MSFTWPLQRIWVDLSREKITKERVANDFARKYLGGRGFNSRLLFDLVPKGVDPLGPKNFLIFGIGPLSGTRAPACGRFTVTTKSPLTDIFGNSNCGGFFGPELRFAGYSQLVISGKHDNPVYLFIDDENIQLKDASQLWGKGTMETQEMIKEEIGDPKAKIVCIGPAGERLVRYSVIFHTPHNLAARVGVGTVMGSKKLKAVVVRGTHKVDIPNPEEYKSASEEMNAIVKKAGNPNFITMYSLDWACEAGVLPIRGNLGKTHVWPYAEKLSGARFEKEFAKGRKGCFNCVIRCKRAYSLDSGKFAGTKGGGPEFSVTVFAPLLDIREMEPMLHMNSLLDEYGIDCSSFGQMVCWAMECYERGILTDEDTGGLKLEWGNSDAVIQLIHLVAKREGIGKLLAEGEKRAPKILGRGSENYIYHCKGISIVSDPRVRPYWATAELTDTRGGEHLGASYIPEAFPKDFVKKYLSNIPHLTDPNIVEGKGKGLKWAEDWVSLITSCGLCTFLWHPTANVRLPFIRVPEILATLISASTGLKFDVEEMLKAGERIYNVEKAFNSREGLTREDDAFTLQKRLREEPVRDGPGKGRVFKPEKILDEYYSARGWDVKTSLQTRKKLEELELGDIADELAKTRAVI